MSYYISVVLSALAAWFIGLLIDANVTPDTLGILELRILFPLLVMGLFILKSIRDSKNR